MRLYKTGQIKSVAYSTTENLKSETGWKLAVLLIKDTKCIGSYIDNNIF